MSRVKAHTRKTASGKTVMVKEHSDKRKKKVAAKVHKKGPKAVPDKPTKGEITLDLHKQGKKKVEADIYGPVAIHRSLEGKGFTVVHIATGLSIKRGIPKAKAVAVIHAARAEGIHYDFKTVEQGRKDINNLTKMKRVYDDWESVKVPVKAKKPVKKIAPTLKPTSNKIPEKGIRGSIVIKLAGGKTEEIEALILGPVAVHKGGGKGNWVITHIISGMSVKTFIPKKQTAIEMVQATRKAGAHFKFKDSKEANKDKENLKKIMAAFNDVLYGGTPMAKSRVKAHTMRTKSGKTVMVKEHEDSRRKKLEEQKVERQKKPVDPKAGRSKKPEDKKRGMPQNGKDEAANKVGKMLELAGQHKTGAEFEKNIPVGMGAKTPAEIAAGLTHGDGDMSMQELTKKLESGGQFYLRAKLSPETLDGMKIDGKESLNPPPDYENDEPVVIASGEVIEGKHRAVAAIRDGRPISAYLPASEWHSIFATQGKDEAPEKTSPDAKGTRSAKTATTEKGSGVDLPARLQKKTARGEKGTGGKIDLSKAEVNLLLEKGMIGFVSAGKNPADEKDKALDDAAVKKRYGQLEGDLKDMGLKYLPALGKYGEEEDSYLVMATDIKRKELFDLGKKYNQDSVIYVSGGNNELMYSTGKNEGKMEVGDGYSKVGSDAKDNFTEVDTADGGKHRFSLNFNFGKYEKIDLSKAVFTFFSGYYNDTFSRHEWPDAIEKAVPQNFLRKLAESFNELKGIRKQIEGKPAPYSRELQGRVNFQGLKVSIENRRGGIRQWYDPTTDTSGITRMDLPYGYIRGTLGVDGDHVDCFLGPWAESDLVCVIHQMKAPDFTQYDEDKVMLGFKSAAEAKAAYLKHYDKVKFFGSMTVMNMEQFKAKVFTNKGQMVKSESLRHRAHCAVIGMVMKINWSKFNFEEFCQGMKVELEHKDVTGGDPLLTGKIALAHLKERGDYYTKLKQVEG